jgi:hypothetical protein
MQTVSPSPSPAFVALFRRLALALFATIFVGSAPFAQASVPTVQSITADSIAIGESLVVTANVTAPGSDLDYLTISVTRQTTSETVSLGSINVSGNNSTADVAWKPGYVGLYTVTVTVHSLDASSTQTKQVEVYSGRLELSRATVGNGVARLFQYGGEILTPALRPGDTSTIRVAPGGNLIIWSGGRVVLSPGFRAEAGSFFWAAVDHDMNGYSDMEEATDTDGDGIFDAWEVDHGMNPVNAADALQDRDGDGINNLNEFLNHTNIDKPDNPNISLVIFTPAF